MGKAVSAVAGATIGKIGKGVGDQGLSATTLELSGKASLGDVVKALESATTPHSAKCAPGVAAAVAVKLSKEDTDKLIEKLQAK